MKVLAHDARLSVAVLGAVYSNAAIHGRSLLHVFRCGSHAKTARRIPARVAQRLVSSIVNWAVSRSDWACQLRGDFGHRELEHDTSRAGCSWLVPTSNPTRPLRGANGFVMFLFFEILSQRNRSIHSAAMPGPGLDIAMGCWAGNVMVPFLSSGESYNTLQVSAVRKDLSRLL